MAQQNINVGAAPNDGTGDPLRTAFQKTQSNFEELYAAVAAIEAGDVESVNGQTGVVVLGAADVGADPAGSASTVASTHTNGLAATDTTGTAISFAVPQIYGSDGAPETGNITIVTTGLVKGMTQLLIHNNGSTPTFGSPIKIISGAYVTGELNYIMLLAVSTTSVLVTITQEV